MSLKRTVVPQKTPILAALFNGYEMNLPRASVEKIPQHRLLQKLQIWDKERLEKENLKKNLLLLQIRKFMLQIIFVHNHHSYLYFPILSPFAEKFGLPILPNYIYLVQISKFV